MQYHYKLKLLNGPLIRREIKLRAGTLSFGTEDVDIFVPLQGERKQLVLSVDESGVVLPEETKGWLNQRQQVLPAGFSLPMNTPVMAAGVAFVLSDLESDLSMFTHWIPGKASLLSGSVSGWLLGGLALLILIGMGGVLLPNSGATSSFDAHKWVSELPKRPEYQRLSLKWLQDGSLQIGGRCQKRSDLSPMLMELTANNISYHYQAMCDDQLLNNVRYTLQLYGYENVTVSAGEQEGSVIIDGQVANTDRWAQVTRLLGSMPGLKSWEVVNRSDQQIRDLMDALKANALLGKVSVRRAQGRILVSGKLTGDQTDTIESIIKQFMKQHPDGTRVVFQDVQNTGNEAGIFPSPIVSVGGNDNSVYLELANGMRLQQGATLPSGYVIGHIDPKNGVELSFNGQLTQVPLGF